MNQIEKKLLQRITDERLRTSLALIRQSAAAIWAADAPRIIQDYTDHGLEHSQRLAGLATKLLAANDGPALTSEEMYLLMAGIYLHDIGMQCDVPRFPEIKTAAETLGARFDVEFAAETASSYTVYEQKAIRKNHQYLSAAWIDVASRTGETALGIAAKTIPEDLIEDLMDVCKHHAKVLITDCPSSLQLNPTGRKRLVAALLRFADELDVDGHRVSIETVKNFRLDPGNAIYWWLHNRTKVVFDARNVVTLTIRLHPDDLQRFGAIVYAAFIDEFRAKNQAVLTVLAHHSISIIISSDSKVFGFNRADPLPPEIAEALFILRERKQSDTLLESQTTSQTTDPGAEEDTLVIKVAEPPSNKGVRGNASQWKKQKLQQLKDRLAGRLEDHEAASRQESYALGAVERLRLQRLINQLELEIDSLEREIKQLEDGFTFPQQ